MNLVLLILNPQFGERFDDLPRSNPIWVVDSERNRQTLNNLPTQYGPITVFPMRTGETAIQVFMRIAQSLDQHHNEFAQDPAYDTLDVYGLPANADALGSLKYLGFSSQHKNAAAMRFFKDRAEE